MAEPIFSTSCPNCGGTVHTHTASAITLVCPYCRSALIREGDTVAQSGVTAAVLEDFTALRIGTTGVWSGRPFTLIGRLQAGYAHGQWNEWHALFADGSTGWLSEAGDQFVFTLPLGTDDAGAPRVPEFDAVTPALTTCAFRNAQYVAADKREIFRPQTGMEGELPDSPAQIPARARVIDWRHQDRFLTTDYGDGSQPPEVFYGSIVTLDELRLGNLRPPEEVRKRAGHLKGDWQHHGCPNCGGSLTWPAGLTIQIHCQHCHSRIAVTSERLRLIEAENRQQAFVRGASLRVGDSGTVCGTHWTVIGIVRHQEYPPLPVPWDAEDIDRRRWRPDGLPWWNEYLLYQPERGFNWLVESRTEHGETKWFEAETLRTWPTGIVPARHPTGARSGDYYASRVTDVSGAFYWQVAEGDVTTYFQTFEVGNDLCAAITPDELVWSRQKPIAPLSPTPTPAAAVDIWRKRIDGSASASGAKLTGKDFHFIARADDDEDDDENLPLSRNPRHYVPLAIFTLANLPPVWHCLATGNSDLLFLTFIGGYLLLPRERSTAS